MYLKVVAAVAVLMAWISSSSATEVPSAVEPGCEPIVRANLQRFQAPDYERIMWVISEDGSVIRTYVRRDGDVERATLSDGLQTAPSILQPPIRNFYGTLIHTNCRKIGNEVINGIDTEVISYERTLGQDKKLRACRVWLGKKTGLVAQLVCDASGSSGPPRRLKVWEFYPARGSHHGR